MELSTILWCVAGLGLASVIIGFLLDDYDATPTMCIGGLVLVLIGLFGGLINNAVQIDRQRTDCLESSVYKRGEQIKAKSVNSSVTVLGLVCTDLDKKTREYEVVTPDGVFLKVPEEALYK